VVGKANWAAISAGQAIPFTSDHHSSEDSAKIPEVEAGKPHEQCNLGTLKSGQILAVTEVKLSYLIPLDLWGKL
jgi:hypothetical protein